MSGGVASVMMKVVVVRRDKTHRPHDTNRRLSIIIKVAPEFQKRIQMLQRLVVNLQTGTKS